MLALHVAHSSPLSTTKQIWYVMMSFLTLVAQMGYPNISICDFFHCFVHPHTALAAIQELIWASSAVLANGALT